MNNMIMRKKYPSIGAIIPWVVCAVLLAAGCAAPDGHESGQYAISIAASVNGTVSADKKTAEKGETVTLNAAPSAQYRLDSIRISGASGFAAVPDKNDGAYIFSMPAEDVTISAVFVSIDLQKFNITVNAMTNGAFELIPEGSQYETLPVQLIAHPDPGNIYRPGSLKVTCKNSKKNIKTNQAEDSEHEWNFQMPAEAVEIDAGFIDENTELYDIIIEKTENGIIICGQTNAVAGDTVTVTIIPEDEYMYKDGSLLIIPDTVNLAETDDDNGNGEKSWTFTMPEQAVHITALFEELPRYAIIPAAIEHGAIAVKPSLNVIAGKEVSISLIINDPKNYRYIRDSISIAGTVSGIKPDLKTAEELVWTFIMPAQAVSVNAALEFIPYFNITIKDTQNGRIIMGGVETSGTYANKARGGSAVTVTAIPDLGYKLTDMKPDVSPKGAVTVTGPDDQGRWCFTMAEQDVEISVDFTGLGQLEIYKGGARNGITADELSDDKKYYKDSVDLAVEEPGHNGNQRVIKITNALNANGNAVQQSFGLFSDTEINLETAAALSFWAKANKPLNIRYAGFGDADPNKRVVYTGENFNQAIPLTAEWKHYIVPVPSPMNGQKTTRAFLFNALIAKGNYVYIDDIEFIESGVTVNEITIPDNCGFLLYGANEAAKLLKGASVKLVYAYSDGTITTLWNAGSSHTLKHNLIPWLMPFIEVSGNGTFHDGIITPLQKNSNNALTLSVRIKSAISNVMSANIIDGITLDDFEDWEGGTIPVTPSAARGYIWNTNASGSIITRDHIATVNNEIHSGLGAGNWRPAADAVNPRGGRNFDAKDLSGRNTAVFRIRVTAGTSVSTNYHTGTVFTFELRNGGTLANKTGGNFFARQFTYNTDGWQEVRIHFSDLAYTGAGEAPAFDVSAVTGYAFSVVNNQGTALRISLDDIAVIYQ